MLKCHTQVVQIHLQLCRRNSHLQFVSRRKIAKKNNKNLYFEGLRSFKVIDVDTNKKLVTSACYNKQHVCTYLQPFLRCTR